MVDASIDGHDLAIECWLKSGTQSFIQVAIVMNNYVLPPLFDLNSAQLFYVC
jgi:hypothetical protein